MKFQLLPLGARFEYEGTIYVKTGPVTATSEQGGQRMIPRFAVLKSLDGALPAPAPKPARKLDEAAVLAAFAGFYGECAALLESADADVRQTRMRLEAARQRFLDSLG